MNSKAKQRAASTGSGRASIEPLGLDLQDNVVGPGLSPPGVPASRDFATPEGPHVFAVGPEDRGQRLDRFLADRFEPSSGVSRTRLQALIVAGAVRIDGQLALTANTRLEQAGAISVDIPPPAPAGPLAQAIPLSIVFEDDHLLVIDKPAGLVVHPAAGHENGTLVNALIAHCGDSLSGIGGVRRPGIVHRLDKDTTGLMVVAKSDPAHKGLADIFADHGRSGSLERLYTAFVWGKPQTRSGTVDLPLGRHPHSRDKVAVVDEARGRKAVTHWSLEAEYGDLCTQIRCRLETGRTHQIRVHLTEIGHPLIGDPVYGTGFRTKAARLSDGARDAVEALGRQALHASLLGFEHPITGAALRFESALPADLARLESALGEP